MIEMDRLVKFCLCSFFQFSIFCFSSVSSSSMSSVRGCLLKGSFGVDRMCLSMFFLSHLENYDQVPGQCPSFASPVAAWELDRVLHQLTHDGAAELVWKLVPFLLLLHPLYHNFIGSLPKTLKPINCGDSSN